MRLDTTAIVIRSRKRGDIFDDQTSHHGGRIIAFLGYIKYRSAVEIRLNVSCHLGFDKMRVFLHMGDVSVAKETVDGFVIHLILGRG